MSLQLNARDEAMLSGREGEAAAFAMRLVASFARSVDPRRLLDIEAAHVDGCLFLGRASLDFVERLLAGKGHVRVPTTLNVGSLDLLHPETFRGDDATRKNARRLIEAHVEHQQIQVDDDLSGSVPVPAARARADQRRECARSGYSPVKLCSNRCANFPGGTVDVPQRRDPMGKTTVGEGRTFSRGLARRRLSIAMSIRGGQRAPLSIYFLRYGSRGYRCRAFSYHIRRRIISPRSRSIGG